MSMPIDSLLALQAGVRGLALSATGACYCSVPVIGKRVRPISEDSECNRLPQSATRMLLLKKGSRPKLNPRLEIDRGAHCMSH
jgi:hypothetical protein